MLTVKQYQRLIEDVEELKVKAAQEQGRLDQLLSSLKKEHGVSTLEEARKLLEKQESELAALEKEQKGLLESLDKYRDRLDG